MDLFSKVVWDNVVDVESVDFVDGDRDLGEFKEGGFIEVIIDKNFDNIFEEKNFISGDGFFNSHTFQDEIDFIHCERLGFDVGLFAENKLIYFSSQPWSLLASKAAVFLVEITETIDTGLGFKLIEFILRFFEN